MEGKVGCGDGRRQRAGRTARVCGGFPNPFDAPARWGLASAVMAALLLAGTASAVPQPAGPYPSWEPMAPAAEGGTAARFGAGELLEYRVTSSRFGAMGAGRMRVDGPVEVRGRQALLLSMEVEGRVALFRFEDRARSWFDPGSGVSLRFEKSERHPLARRNEEVEVLPEEGRWRDADGRSGILRTHAPLDELSFIYVVRMLDLDEGQMLSLDRHFDEARNPVVVRGLGRERVWVPAGIFQARVVEMDVRDPDRYGDEVHRIRIHLTDDELRIPLRITSRAPMVGTLVMALERWRQGS